MLKERVDVLIEKLNNDYYNDNVVYKIGVEVGRKYYKLVQIRKESNRTESSHAFIDKENGNIYKPAGWNSPAKHARGNVNSEDFGFSAFGRYGVNYLRG